MTNEARLVIVCGSPGAGKSVFGHHISSNSNAMVFESDDYLARLYGAGANGIDGSGDFTTEALERVYMAMAAGVRAALASHIKGLVLVVGSFRKIDQRQVFRSLANECGASVITVAIDCYVQLAGRRIEERRARG